MREEFTKKEHSTMKITGVQENRFRCFTVLSVSSPTSADFSNICKRYNVSEVDVISVAKEKKK